MATTIITARQLQQGTEPRIFEFMDAEAYTRESHIFVKAELSAY